MLFIGGLAAYTVVWDLGDVGVGLMTLFNIFILFPMSKKALEALKDYEKRKKEGTYENHHINGKYKRVRGISF